MAGFFDTTCQILSLLGYTMTSLQTSTIIFGFSVPTSVILSITIGQVTFYKNHYIGIALVIGGIGLSMVNEIMFIENDDDKSKPTNPILGDFLIFFAAILCAVVFMMQEMLIKSAEDVFDYLGSVGICGFFVTLVAAYISGEFEELSEIDRVTKSTVIWNVLMSAVSQFAFYTIIPFFIMATNATFFNLST